MDKKKWTKAIVNDPNIDFDLVIELEYEERIVGEIRPGREEQELIWHEDMTKLPPIPANWLLEILLLAKRDIKDRIDEELN